METGAYAGDFPVRKNLPHATPPWVDPSSIFFVTIYCAKRTHNQLCDPTIAAAIFETVEFRQKRGDWFIHLLLLMPDHLHGLVSFPRDGSMKKTISNWKEIVAKKCQVSWQRDFFDHRLRAEESFEEKAHYIRMNPVRRQLASSPVTWPYLWEPK